MASRTRDTAKDATKPRWTFRDVANQLPKRDVTKPKWPSTGSREQAKEKSMVTQPKRPKKPVRTVNRFGFFCV